MSSCAHFLEEDGILALLLSAGRDIALVRLFVVAFLDLHTRC